MSLVKDALHKIGFKRGDIYAESLANQSYLYRLGFVWIEVLSIKDKRNTSLNPISINLSDIVWVCYFAIISVVLIFIVATLGWAKAYSLAKVEPIIFFKDRPTTNYVLKDRWYYDNGKINTY